MLLQKTFWPLLLETFMNEPGNKTHGECWAFLQRWTKTKSCRCYLSYQLPVILPMMRYCWPTARLGKSWESCTKQLYWIPLADPTRLLTGSCSSSPWALTWRMPRGSILPTLLFNIYAKPAGNMMKWYRQQCQTVCWRHMDLCAFFPSCRQHSPKPLSVESKGGIAGRGRSQKRQQGGWLEVGNVTNCELISFMIQRQTAVDNLIEAIITRAFLSLSPVSIILLSSSGLAMLMCVFHIWAVLRWLYLRLDKQQRRS